MIAFKLFAVAAAFAGAVVASDAHDDSVCISEAPPVTVTVVVTQCPANPPAASTSPPSSVYGVPPKETTVIPVPPAPSGPASSGTAPSGSAPSGPASSAPAPSGPPASSAPPASGTTPAVPTSSGGGYQTPTESRPGTTASPSGSASPTPPEQSTNAAAFPTAFPGMGTMVAGGLVLNAAIAVLV